MSLYSSTISLHSGGTTRAVAIGGGGGGGGVVQEGGGAIVGVVDGLCMSKEGGRVCMTCATYLLWPHLSLGTGDFLLLL